MDAARLRDALVGLGEDALDQLDFHLARPRYRPQLTMLAEESGAIVGCALAAHTRVRLGAATLDAGHLDAILIAPIHPHPQDVAQALIGALLASLYDQGLPLMTLDGSPGLFAALGFAPYRLESRVRLRRDAGSGMREAGNAAPSSRILHSSALDDLDDLAALYDASYRSVPLSEVRAMPDWQHWMAGGETFVLKDTHGRAVAYARMAAGSVKEAAAADAGAARTLLTELLRHGAADELELLLPPAHQVTQAALHLGGTLTLSAPDPQGHQPIALAGVVDLAGALAALAPELTRRLAASRYAGWNGAIRIELDASRVTIVCGGGRVSVTGSEHPADVRLRRVTLPGLAQLLLGYRSAGDLRATGDLDCDDQTLGLVDSIFPV